MVPSRPGRRLEWQRAFRVAVLLLPCALCGCPSKSRLGWQTGSRAPGVEPLETTISRPPTPETLRTTATLLAKQGQSTESERLLRSTLAHYPDYAPAYCILAELHMREKRTDGAIQVLTAGMDATGGTPYLLNNLGMCWLAKGEPARALEMFTLAAGSVPGNARYRANMAAALGMAGRYEEALSLFEQVVSRADAHRNLAVLCEARNDAARAAEGWEMVNQLSTKRD